jgi:hypothetical protein
MSRLPFPEEVSIADAMAFEAFTPEQKRIAVAGVAIHEYLKDRIEEEVESARFRADEEGFARGRGAIDEALHHALDRLALLRQKFSTSDTRYTELGAIIGDLSKLVQPT